MSSSARDILLDPHGIRREPAIFDMTEIVFFDAADVDAALDLYNSGHGKVLLVPLSPIAAYECGKKKGVYRALESFIPREAVVRSRPASSQANNAWLALVDSTLQSCIEGFRQRCFQPAKLYTMALYGFLDEFNAAQIAWQGIRSELTVTRIHVSERRLAEPTSWGRVLPQQKMTGFILPHFAKADGVECLGLKARRIPQGAASQVAPAPLKRKVFDALRSKLSHANRREIKLLLRVGAKSYLRSRFNAWRSPKGGRVLFVGGGYDLGDLAIRLRHRGWRVDIIEFPDEFIDKPQADDPALHAGLSAAIEKLLSMRAFRHPFPESPYSLDAHFIEIFTRWALRIVPRQWAVFRYCHETGAPKQYRGIVNWAYGEGENSALVDAFRSFGVPAYCFQHGGASRNTWLTDYYQEYLQSDVYLCYGEGQANIFKTLDQVLPDTSKKPHIVPVGSVRLEGLRTSRPKIPSLVAALKARGKKTLLYIPTVFDHPGFTLNDAWLLGADYFEFQAKALARLAATKGWHIIYKGFPGTLDIYEGNPIEAFIKDQQYPNVSYVEDIPITTLMWAVDAVIIDHNQTALNEILLTDKPILMFDQGAVHPWTTEARSRDALRKSLRLALTADDFLAQIDALVSDGAQAVDRSEVCDFSLRYGLFMNDGKSLSRAALAIESFLAK